MTKKWIIDVSSIYEQDERLVKVLLSDTELEKKWLHQMVDSEQLTTVNTEEYQEPW